MQSCILRNNGYKIKIWINSGKHWSYSKYCSIKYSSKFSFFIFKKQVNSSHQYENFLLSLIDGKLTCVLKSHYKNKFVYDLLPVNVCFIHYFICLYNWYHVKISWMQSDYFSVIWLVKWFHFKYLRYSIN